MFEFRTIPALAVLLICFHSAAWSQTQKSTVTGLVTDSSGAVLPGAEVDLEPGGFKSKTNAVGAYVVKEVSPGSYTLNISFIGLAPFSQKVDVAAAQATRVNATLQVPASSQEIEVRDARVYGEDAAINEERSAPNILQVLTSDVINSLPNANVADAIGRLPSVTLERDEGEGKYVQIRGTEPRYSNVTVDGVDLPSPEGVRQIKLDVIPAELVDAVEISKTSLANQDAGGIGGSVKLTTRTATDLPTITLYGTGGFTPILDTRGLDEFGGTIGKRFGKEKRLGLLFGGTYTYNGRGINDVEPSPTTETGANGLPVGTYSSIDLRDYAYDRTRYGFDGTADYRLNDASDVYVRALYAHFNNFGDRIVYSPSINTFLTPTLGDVDGSISMNASIRRPVQSIGSIELGGRHNWGANTFTWEASAARAATTDQGYSTASFNGIGDLAAIQFAVNTQDPYRPKLLSQNVANLFDPSLYQLADIDVNKTYNPQVNLAAGASYSRGYNWNGHLGTFELGGKYRNAHKFEDSNELDYLYNGTSGFFTNFVSGLTDPKYYNDSYSVGPFANFSKITSFFNGNLGDFSVDQNATHINNDPNNWDLVEQIGAGYLMNTIDFGKWRLYAGIRFESTNEKILGYSVLQNNGTYISTSPLRRSYSYVSPLPSAELRYTFNNSSDLRLAYGRNIARPQYGDIVPYISLDNSNFRGDVGNPDLRATSANSYDILYEKYLNPVGLIQAGLFYKYLSKPIYYITTNVTESFEGAPQVYQVTEPQNGTKAWIAGFEISFQQRLSYLTGALNGLGISANYSYTDSRAGGLETLLGRTDHPSLQRQAPHTWNISPTYDKGRISLRVGIAYNDSNIWQYQYSDGVPLGKSGPLGDTYLYAHLQIDAQASIRMSHGLSAIISGLNLNNEVFGFYNGSKIWPIQREYYKPSYSFGFRWDPVREKF